MAGLWYSQVEVISGVARRLRFSPDLKLAVVAETMQPGISVSYVALATGCRRVWYSAGGG
jgi:transposase